MKEFRVNDYISLRLENGQTVIYIKEKKFRQCKSLFFNIQVDKIQNYFEIESIDDAADKLEKDSEGTRTNDQEIPPEIEFWGHCSNIQAWAENDYNTCILHRNLAFPLLQKLTELGDEKAKKIFKEEIAKRLSGGHPSVIQFLSEEGYTEYLNREEFLFSILIPEEAEIIIELDNSLKSKLKFVPKLNEEPFSFTIKNKHINSIDLSNCNLKRLPESVLNLKFLEELWLSNNELVELPKNIKNLKNLKILVISGNELKQLPDNIGDLSLLKVLNMSSNPIIYLPESIGKLKYLEELDLMGCKIISLPISIKNLKHLRFLNLSDNKLKEIPKEISHLTRLEKFDLRGNPIKKFS